MVCVCVCVLLDVITRMRQILFSKRNLQFGAFLGSYSAGFLAINSILWYLPLPRSLRLLLAGKYGGGMVNMLDAWAMKVAARAQTLTERLCECVGNDGDDWMRLCCESVTLLL